MAIVGGAVLTPAMGLLSQYSHSIAVAYAIPLACYFFVAFYAFVGCKIRQRIGASPAAA